MSGVENGGAVAGEIVEPTVESEADCDDEHQGAERAVLAVDHEGDASDCCKETGTPEEDGVIDTPTHFAPEEE